MNSQKYFFLAIFALSAVTSLQAIPMDPVEEIPFERNKATVKDSAAAAGSSASQARRAAGAAGDMAQTTPYSNIAVSEAETDFDSSVTGTTGVTEQTTSTSVTDSSASIDDSPEGLAQKINEANAAAAAWQQEYNRVAALSKITEEEAEDLHQRCFSAAAYWRKEQDCYNAYVERLDKKKESQKRRSIRPVIEACEIAAEAAEQIQEQLGQLPKITSLRRTSDANTSIEPVVDEINFEEQIEANIRRGAEAKVAKEEYEKAVEFAKGLQETKKKFKEIRYEGYSTDDGYSTAMEKMALTDSKGRAATKFAKQQEDRKVKKGQTSKSKQSALETALMIAEDNLEEIKMERLLNGKKADFLEKVKATATVLKNWRSRYESDYRWNHNFEAGRKHVRNLFAYGPTKELLLQAQNSGAIASSIAAYTSEQAWEDNNASFDKNLLKEIWPDAIREEEGRNETVGRERAEIFSEANQAWANYIKPPEAPEDAALDKAEMLEKEALDKYAERIKEIASDASKSEYSAIAEGAWAARVQNSTKEASQARSKAEKLKDHTIRTMVYSVVPWFNEQSFKTIFTSADTLFQAAELAMTNFPGAEASWRKLIEDSDEMSLSKKNEWKEQNNEKEIRFKNAEIRNTAELNYRFAVRNFHRLAAIAEADLAAWESVWPKEYHEEEYRRAMIYKNVIDAESKFKIAVKNCNNNIGSLSYKDAFDKYKETYAAFTKAKALINRNANTTYEQQNQAILAIISGIKRKKALHKSAEEAYEAIDEAYNNVLKAQRIYDEAYSPQKGRPPTKLESIKIAAERRERAQKGAEGKIKQAINNFQMVLTGLRNNDALNQALRDAQIFNSAPVKNYWELVFKKYYETKIDVMKAEADQEADTELLEKIQKFSDMQL